LTSLTTKEPKSSFFFVDKYCMKTRILKGYDSFSLDRMEFAKPIKPKHVERIEEPEVYGLIKAKAEDAPVQVPPANSSMETLQELKHMINDIENVDPTETKKKVEKYDEDILWKFEKYCKKHDLDFNKEWFEQLIEEAGLIIIKLKYKYNRPRPFQLAPKLGLQLASTEAKTASSPSFPSGHSAESHLVADVLSKIYPVHHGAFQAIAEKASYSRYIGGLHFPSDIEYGQQIGHWLADRTDRSSI